MVIAQLVGGLANQMVIYAAARSLAEHLHVELKLDITQLDKDNSRNYALHHLGITAALATQEEINKVLRKSQFWLINKIQKKVHKFYKGNALGVYQDPPVKFDPNFFALKDNTYIKGTYISKSYFESIASILKQEFQIKSPLSPQTERLLKIMASQNSISIHVRRGDYADNGKTQQVHGLLSLDFYKKAIQYCDERMQAPVYYVFSDDVSWVKKNLDINGSIYFIDHTNADRAYEDVLMMSQCKHNIIANSGFSFWGAWLNANKEKLVIAPEQWFADKALNKQFDLLPEEWVKLSIDEKGL